jgi:hypothetical protein
MGEPSLSRMSFMFASVTRPEYTLDGVGLYWCNSVITLFDSTEAVMKHEHHTPSGAPGRRGTGGPRRGGPFGRPGGWQHGGWQQGDLPDATDAAAWFAGRIPDDVGGVGQVALLPAAVLPTARAHS